MKKYKDDFEYNLWEWFNYDADKGNRKNKKFYLWLNRCLNEPVETLVKMKIFGYKVKEEKCYIVKMKNISKGSNCLNYNKNRGLWEFVDEAKVSSYRIKHTKEELKEAGFDWVFS